MSSESLDLKQFHFDLPDAKIAKYPLENRASAKLLVYEKGQIKHHRFNEIPNLLPKDSFMVFNDTKVIPARLIFHKSTGARIEIFLLDPVGPSNVYEEVMNSKKSCSWHVMIGNAKKWKSEQPLTIGTETFSLSVRRTKEDQVTFTWESDETFSDILTKAGKIPLPPYLGRETTEADMPRYQTVYSKSEGAVAAPTAGLHFTDEVISHIEKLEIPTDYLTLHVSAGTFQPIKADKVEDHPMHREQILVSRKNLLNLLKHEKVVAVGTTSMRTLESLFWYGQILSENPNASFQVFKDSPYQSRKTISRQESLELVLARMDHLKTDLLIGHTEIFIYPGYTFQICKGLITNYHLPGSTLVLLVAAFVGEDWRAIYNEALNNEYRFLSYGDSSLLLP